MVNDQKIVKGTGLFNGSLNIAAWQTNITTLGPGTRAVVWVQGCPFHCHGCIAPDWIPQSPAIQIPPEDLAQELLSHENFTGITLSGGEPMLQAEGLRILLEYIQAERKVDVICFTGFRMEVIRGNPAMTAARRLLNQIDVLIDGAYMQDRNDDRGLRGSSNQRIHHLTDRLRDFDFINAPRSVELTFQENELWIAGIPPRAFSKVLPTIG
ncbi:radical SAM protein [bacterium]|nr:radical SAM protein [bacterium]